MYTCFVMWSGLNRRRFPRAEYKCRINIKRRHLPSKVIPTHTENIGIGGVCVILKEDVRIFHDVRLEIFLKNGKDPFSCGGSVVWVVKRTSSRGKVGYDTGIEFAGLKEAEMARILSLVDKIIEQGKEA